MMLPERMRKQGERDELERSGGVRRERALISMWWEVREGSSDLRPQEQWASIARQHQVYEALASFTGVLAREVERETKRHKRQ